MTVRLGKNAIEKDHKGLILPLVSSWFDSESLSGLSG